MIKKSKEKKKRKEKGKSRETQLSVVATHSKAALWRILISTTYCLPPLPQEHHLTFPLYFS